MTTTEAPWIFSETTNFAATSNTRRRRFACNGPQLVRLDTHTTSEVLVTSGSHLNLSNPLVTEGSNVTTMNPLSVGLTGNASEITRGLTQEPNTKGEDPIHIFIMYTLVFLLAVVGNSLVMVTLASNKRMRTVTNSFLLSLSVSDLLLALICMPISLIGRMLKRFIFGSLLCKIFPYFMGISVSVSTFTMLAISIERYNAICNPLKSRGWQTKSHAYKVCMRDENWRQKNCCSQAFYYLMLSFLVIAGIWLISFVIMSPFLVFSRLQYMPILKMGKCTLACRLHFNGPSARQAWYVIQIVSLFCIPGFLMTVAYAKVCVKIFEGFQFEAKKEKKVSSVRYSSVNGTEMSRLSVPTSNGKSDHLDTSRCSSKKNKSEEKDCLKPVTSPLLRQRGSKSGFARDSRLNQTAAQLKAKKRVVKMLIVIVVLYFVCWTPLFIVNVWKAFDPKGARKSIEGGIEIIQLMSYISTCVNPVIYCFMHKKFREGFIRAFLCCLPRSCVTTLETKPTAPSGVTITENMSRSASIIRSPRPSIRVINTDA